MERGIQTTNPAVRVTPELRVLQTTSSASIKTFAEEIPTLGQKGRFDTPNTALGLIRTAAALLRRRLRDSEA